MRRNIWIVAGSVLASAPVAALATRLTRGPQPEPRRGGTTSSIHPAVETAVRAVGDAKVEPRNVDGSSTEEPQSATDSTGKIAPPDLRRSAYGRSADSYAERDPAVSRQWLESLSALPEKWKYDLARRINR